MLFLAVSGGAGAQTLSVYPDAVRLDHGADFQRLVVMQTREDGVTLDITAEAEVSFDAEGVVELDETHVFRPVADGTATAMVRIGDLSAALPVTVANVETVPAMSFRNDVQAVLMRAGCNSGACHGSAQGKNGFGLSLFGFDPDSDYLRLTRQLRGRRLDPAKPEESLVLMKATGAVDHEGGSRFDADSELYGMMRRWIAEGAADDPADLPTLEGIEILPPEAVLEGEGAVQRFTVVARYSDGTDRDVTRLAILSTSDEEALRIDEDGLATAGSRGEGYVMARFGTFAVVSKTMVLPAGLDLSWPEDVVARNYIDELVFDKLRKLRIPPAPAASDAEFVRRVYLDILGLLPTAEETAAFVEDPSAAKRETLVDALLERPEFADVWAMKYAEILRVVPTPQGDTKGMHRYNDWIRQSVSEGKPVDRMVRELLTAEGGNFAEPAANFYTLEDSPTVMAENVAQAFLGIQISCAQCHNHPFERWTMDDYYSFSAFFGQVGKKSSSDPREVVVFNRGSGEVKNIRDNQDMAPKFLGGPVPEVAGRDRRAVLAEWLTAPDNPWFARNAANRVWQHFLGIGVVDPVDDFRVSNPPSNPQLLDALGERLVEYEYDLRRLVRDICNSHTYGQSTRPRDPEAQDGRNFSHATVRRLGAETLLDAVAQVTETRVKFPSLPLGARAVQVAAGNSGNYFLELFGRPPRESVCACERRNDPTLAQVLHLINGDTIQQAITAADGRLEKRIAEEVPSPDIVRELYLSAFSRPPTEEEQARLVEYVDAAEDRRAALQDVYWTVLNAKEFVFNH